MRCLNRNKTAFFYALYLGKKPIVDEDGNESGEYQTVYSAPVHMEANISPANGSTQAEPFGSSVQYDKVIVTDDTDCPIDEQSVLFIDNVTDTFLHDEYWNILCTEADVPLQIRDFQFDYIVKKVARSQNSISYAISRVDVSAGVLYDEN